MKKIEGFSNYFVTIDGAVFSALSGKFLSAADNGEGYLRYSLRDDQGNPKTKLAHRLVAEAWIPNPENKPTVNHIDGNKHNNHKSNLEWNTYLENDSHARSLKLRDDEASRILNHIQAYTFFKMVMDGHTKKDICDCFGITPKQYSIVAYTETYSDIRSEFEWEKRPVKRDVLSQERVILICKMLQSGKSAKQVASEMNIPYPKVWAIKKRKSFTLLSSSFNF